MKVQIRMDLSKNDYISRCLKPFVPMQNKKITVKELAQKLGVSVSTVSKALNDSYEISEKTKKRVRRLAK